MELSRNEIITLHHLAAAKQADEIPEGLTEAQFYTAARSLKEKGMVRAAFVEGGKLEAIKLLIEGQAVLDDMKDDEKRIRKTAIHNAGITQDQYKLMEYAKKTGICENIFNIPWAEYKDYIWCPIYKRHLIKTNYDGPKNTYFLTRDGEQLLDDINDTVYRDLSKNAEEKNEQQKPIKSEIPKTNSSSKIKYSGFCIDKDRITDLIKVIWAMHAVGLFATPSGKKCTINSVMNAFAEFLKSEQLKKYSSYKNKGQKATKNTYLDIFDQLKDASEKDYDTREKRKNHK